MSPVAARHDIELDGVPLMLWREQSRRPGTDYEPAEMEGGFGASALGAPAQPFDVPRIWPSFAGRMGYSRAQGDPSQGAGTYAYARNLICRYGGVVTPGGAVTAVTLPPGATSAPSAAFEMNGHVYFAAGRYVLRVQNGTSTPVIERDLGASFVADSAVVFAGRAYVGGTSVGLPAPIWEFDGTNWTQSTTVSLKMLVTVYWIAGGIGADRLLGVDGTSSFRYTAVAAPNPLAIADYSASIAVGKAAYPIRSVAAAPQRAFFAKSNGLHDVFADAGGNVRTPNLTPYWERQLSADNGVYTAVHGNHLYASFNGGTDRVDITSLERQDGPEWADTGAYLPNETPIYGIGPISADRGWLVNFKNNGTDSHLCYGKDRREIGIGGVGPMLWHGSEATLPGEKVGFVYLTAPAGTPRMWIGATSTAGIASMRWLSLPKAPTPLQDFQNNGPMRFAADGSLHLSDDTWGDANSKKIMRRFTLQGDNLGAGALINLYARTEDDDYIGQGTANSSPRAQITPRGNQVEGFSFGLRLDLVGNSTVPAILREVKAEAEVNPDLFDVRRYPILIARRAQTGGDSRDYRVPRGVWRLLRRLQASGPVSLSDEVGEQASVNVHPSITYRSRKDEAGDGWSRVAYVTMTILSETAGQVMRWGVGDRWDANQVYGAAGVTAGVFRWGAGSKYQRGERYAA